MPEQVREIKWTESVKSAAVVLLSLTFYGDNNSNVPGGSRTAASGRAIIQRLSLLSSGFYVNNTLLLLTPIPKAITIDR